MNIRIPLLAFATVLAATAFAQDSLFYTNGNVIVGQVEEIGLNAIKYRTSSDGRSVLIEVDKQDLSSLKLKGGQAYTFTSTATDTPYSTTFLDQKNALTFDVIAPALNHLTIGYERVLTPRASLVVKAGYIGLWKDTERDAEIYNSQGGLLTAGVKVSLPRSPKRITSSGDTHPFAGWYLRPEILFSAWTKSYYYSYHYYEPMRQSTYNYTSAALVLNIGREWFLGEHITFDISGGLGYGTQWYEGKSTDVGTYAQQEYSFSHTFLGGSPLVLCGGMRFGYAF